MDKGLPIGMAVVARIRASGQRWKPHVAPLIFAALLSGQSLYLLAQRAIGFGIGWRAFAAHQTLLLAFVCIQAALWFALGRTRGARALGIGVATLIQGSLLLLYTANHLSLHFVEIALDWSTVEVYLIEPEPILSAVGLSGLGLVLVLAAFFVACAYLNLRVLRPHPPARSFRASLAYALAACLLLTPAAAAPAFYRKHEFLFALQGRTPAAFGPPALFFSTGRPRQTVRYAPGIAPPVITERPLVLITIDSLRPDSLGVYGGAFTNTPFLSRLQAEGKLTSYPEAHSVCTFSYCGIMGILASRQWREFTAPPDTIFDALAAHGYRNHVFASGQFRNYFDLSRQFGPHVEVLRDGLDRPGRANNDDNVAMWLKALPKDDTSKQFFYFHLMSVHRLAGYSASGDFGREITLPAGVTDTPTIRAYRQRHFAAVRKADQTIAGIFSWLEARGLLRDALVVITADHGEYLGEAGRVAHGKPPHRVVTHVPFMVYDARGGNWPQRMLVSTKDAAPTLLAAIGAPIPINWTGIALQRKTERCAVETASDGHRAIIGTSEGDRWRLWHVEPGLNRTAGTFLEPEQSLATPSARVTSSGAQTIAAHLQDCAARR